MKDNNVINHISCSIELPKRNFQWKYTRLACTLLAIVLAGLHFIRIFENNFWEDEAYTIGITSMSTAEMLQTTAGDVHPPLYYLIVQIFCRIFGASGTVYHLASVTPYLLIILLSMTYIWKKYGKETAMVLVVLASLLNSAIEYNLEVRMYSWGEFFVLAAYLALHRILEDGKAKNYILFVCASLGAAYTHYYALLSVAFFYAVLLFLALFTRRKMLKPVLISIGATIVGYLPWLAVFIGQFTKTAGDYWITTCPTFRECMEYVFSSMYSVWFLRVFVVTVVFAFIYEAGILRFKRNDTELALKVALGGVSPLSPSALWIVSGVLTIVGTIGVGIGVSKIFTPVLLLRYLVPVSVVAWMLTGYCISKCKLKSIYTVFVVALMLITGVPNCITAYRSEQELYDRSIETLAATTEMNSEEVTILSTVSTTFSTITDYYYPKATEELVDLTALPTLDEEKKYWLVTYLPIDETAIAALNEQGYQQETIIECGNIGGHNVYVYRLDRMAESQ